jgi:glycerol-3-phosphate dehydrogenase
MKEFTNINRKEDFKKIDQKVYDLIVVGGGITGAGIALDAANRGMSVALFEMQDFAQGTQAFNKLVHGGYAIWSTWNLHLLSSRKIT